MQILKNSNFLSQEIENKEIFVLAGPNGVGKTEIALNLTSFFNSLSIDSYLLDLDFTKADFTARSDRFWSELSILPRGKGKYSDTPVWDEETSKILSLIDKNHRLIVDLGGDLKGMKSWRSLQSFWRNKKVHLTLVTNFCRPFSEEEAYLEFIERAKTFLNFDFHSVISNTHLIEYTDEEILKMGWQKAGDFSHRENLPIFFVSIWKDLTDSLSWNIFDSAVVSIRRFLHLPWTGKE
ncbi:MAG: hypothetical protein KBH15_00210 [Candidatus Atribacteria bacterium]|nr:hypothetical protein [Candidatus Atribacteria bacterium]